MVALIVGAGIGYSGIAGNALTRTERITSSTTLITAVTSYETTTSTITSTTTSVSYSTVTSSGLQLLISLSAGSIPYNGTLLPHVVLFNTSNGTLTLTPGSGTNPTLAAWGVYNSGCPLAPLDGLVNYAVFQGHLTAANLSQAGPPFRLAPPIPHSCVISGSPVQSVEFRPQSDIAVISHSFGVPETLGMQLDVTTGRCTVYTTTTTGSATQNGTTTTTTSTGFSYACSTAGPSLYGYWEASTILGLNSTQVRQALHSFPVGSYTVAAEDIWNQTAFAYFQVVPA